MQRAFCTALPLQGSCLADATITWRLHNCKPSTGQRRSKEEKPFRRCATFVLRVKVTNNSQRRKAAAGRTKVAEFRLTVS